MAKWLYEDVKNYVEEHGCKLLSNEYVNMHTKMSIQCPCGNSFEREFTKFIHQSKVCPDCGRKQAVEKKKQKNIGKKYGRLTIIKEVIDKEKTETNHTTYWLCQCECGNTCVVGLNNLTSETTCSCGECFKRELIGKKFNKLTVVSVNEEESSKIRGRQRYTYFNCLCDCGNTTTVGVNSLGKTISCGCAWSEKMYKDYTGERFGKLVAVRPTEYRSCYESDSTCGNVIWEWKCDCGNMYYSAYYNVSKAKLPSCGCWYEEWRGGENCGHWKGGVSEVDRTLRNIIEREITWKQDCLEYYNYTCDITGQRGGRLEVHHLTSFSTIVEDAHKLNNIERKPHIGDYTQEDWSIIKQYVVDQHCVENGVVLSKDIHTEFHNEYMGSYHVKTTHKDYEEFKRFKQKSSIISC